MVWQTSPLKVFSRVFFKAFIAINFLACSSGPVRDTNTPQGAYEDALDYVKEQRYQESLVRLNDLKNRFPYSNYAVLAELKIADVYYEMESYPEAQASYELFREFHPKHPQIDYVTFRIAKSYYSRLPDTVDRDLTAADSAIRFFDEVIRRYPDSNYAKEAKELRKTALNKLAAKEYYVAQFYFHRSQFDSALGRYENLVKIYPEDELVAKAHYGAAVSAAKLGQRNRSRIHVEALLEKFPGTPEAKKAKVGLE